MIFYFFSLSSDDWFLRKIGEKSLATCIFPLATFRLCCEKIGGRLLTIFILFLSIHLVVPKNRRKMFDDFLSLSNPLLVLWRKFFDLSSFQVSVWLLRKIRGKCFTISFSS